jgi:hypothetical protein
MLDGDSWAVKGELWVCKGGSREDLNRINAPNEQIFDELLMDRTKTLFTKTFSGVIEAGVFPVHICPRSATASHSIVVDITISVISLQNFLVNSHRCS